MFSPVQRPGCFTSRLSKKKKKKDRVLDFTRLSVSYESSMAISKLFPRLEVKGDPSFSEKLVVAIVRGGVEHFVAALWNGCRLKTQTVPRKTLQLISKRNFFSTWPAVIRRFFDKFFLVDRDFFFKSFQNSLLIEKSWKVENKSINFSHPCNNDDIIENFLIILIVESSYCSYIFSQFPNFQFGISIFL